MNRAKGILGICILFICGAIVGGAAVHFHYQRTLASIIAKGPEGFHQVIARHLEKELSLDESQRGQLQSILEAHQQRILSIMRPHHLEFKQSFEQTAERIRAILKPEQLQRFNELEERRKRQLRAPFLAPEENANDGAQDDDAS